MVGLFRFHTVMKVRSFKEGHTDGIIIASFMFGMDKECLFNDVKIMGSIRDDIDHSIEV